MNTNTNNVLTAIAILGNYNRFFVDDGNRRYMCSGITFNAAAPDFVEFQKAFSVPEYSDSAIIDASATPDCLTLTSAKGTVYRITAAYDPTAEQSAERADNLQALIDWTRSGADGELVRLVVDFGKLGRLNVVQAYRVQSWINRNFNGKAIKYQIPRTVYFETDGSGIVRGGIYSLEEEKPVSNGAWWASAALLDALDAVARATA